MSHASYLTALPGDKEPLAESNGSSGFQIRRAIQYTKELAADRAPAVFGRNHLVLLEQYQELHALGLLLLGSVHENAIGPQQGHVQKALSDVPALLAAHDDDARHTDTRQGLSHLGVPICRNLRQSSIAFR